MNPAPHSPPAGLNPIQRVLFAFILGLLWILRHLPDKPIYRVTYTLGAGASLLMPERRATARANMRRVCRWLAANDMASPRVARAARDERALDRMVRATFGHWALSYVEAAMAPRYGRDQLEQRVIPSDPAATAEAMSMPQSGEPGPIHMTMHFGAVDLAALYGARVGPVPMTGPMEIVESPLGRAYFERMRTSLDVTIVPLGDAATALVAALRRGEAVGVVADRNIVGKGSTMELFGAPARLPTGPAVLAVQTGAPLYLEVIERTGFGAWAGHTIRLRPRPGSTRREAARSMLEQQARGFEQVIARSPEQWTTLFFRIWEDESEA